jgi:hypothetical protein
MSTALTPDDHRAILKEMAEVGMRLVRDLPERVETSSPETLALAYTRLSRAVRLTLSLDRQFDVPAPVAREQPKVPIWERDGVSREVWEAENLRKSRTAEAYDLIEHAIDSDYGGRERDRLTEALYERIDEAADEQRLLSTMPIAQVVALICHDLGIRPRWDRLEPDEDEDFDPDERTLRALRLGKYEVPDIPPPCGEGESAPADPGGASEAPQALNRDPAPALEPMADFNPPPDPRPWMA